MTSKTDIPPRSSLRSERRAPQGRAGIWALLPFKGAAGAKKRLASALDPTEREGLVLAMVRDVLDALVGSRLLAGTVIVSRAPVAAQLATEFGVEVFADSAADLSGAVVEAGEYVARSRGATGTLFVPGDVPLVTPAEIDTVLHGHSTVTLVPDANDVGTNAAACSPPNAFEYLFDGKSFKPHIAAARRAGLEPRIVRLPGFGLDVDTIDELRTLAAKAQSTRTDDFLKRSGIAERITGARLHSA
ncbi:MAG: 2-phospho-L-lactate guanylyltransferase [Gammaproteobacteria bacterium]|nr:2-phospho-L-lactate guanylyltransferase [Gammaproteobacteria bacterium]